MQLWYFHLLPHRLSQAIFSTKLFSFDTYLLPTSHFGCKSDYLEIMVISD